MRRVSAASAIMLMLASGCARDAETVWRDMDNFFLQTGRNAAAEGPNSDQSRGAPPTPQPPPAGNSTTE